VNLDTETLPFMRICEGKAEFRKYLFAKFVEKFLVIKEWLKASFMLV